MVRLTLEKILEHWPAKVLALAVAIGLFFMHQVDALLSRSMVLPLRLIKNNSMVPASVFDPRVRISVRGPSEIVQTLQERELEAIADFSKIQTEGRFKTPIKVNFKGLAQDSARLEIAVDPSEFTVHLEKKTTKNLVIQPDLLPPAEKDYKLVSTHLIPPMITVEGPRSLLDKITSIKTELIDLRDKTENFTINVKVQSISPLFSFPNGINVVLHGEIYSNLATLIIEKRDTRVEGLDPSLELKTPLAPVKIRLRGREEILETLSSEQIQLVLDLSEYTRPAEIIRVPYKVEVPSEVDLLEIVPSSITVILEKAP